MNATIPPWLDVNPSGFMAAREAGGRAGAQSGATAAGNVAQGNEMALKRQQMAQEAAMQAQDVQTKRMQIQAQAQEAMSRLSLQKQEADRDFSLKHTSLSVNSELNRQKMQQQAKAVAQHYQAQQGYQSAFRDIKSKNQELSDSDAAIKAASVSGFMPTGLRDVLAQERTQFDPNKHPLLVDGKQVGVVGPDGTPHYAPGKSSGLAPEKKAEMVMTLMKDNPLLSAKEAKAQVGDILSEDGSASSGSGGTPPPEVGEVSEGYRFKGGNPADKGNWERVDGAAKATASMGSAPVEPTPMFVPTGVEAIDKAAAAEQATIQKRDEEKSSAETATKRRDSAFRIKEQLDSARKQLLLVVRQPVKQGDSAIERAKTYNRLSDHVDGLENQMSAYPEY